MMIRTVVVPLDGSALAEQALPFAYELARRGNAGLVLVRVHEAPSMAIAEGYRWNEEVRRRELEYLAGVAQRARARGCLEEEVLADGPAAQAISDVARRHESPLIVMCSHGRTGAGRYWLGSVTDAVVRHGAAPVLMLRAVSEVEPDPRIQKILVPTDGSARSARVAAAAAGIASIMGASLELIHLSLPAGDTSVVADEELRTTVRRLTVQHPGLDVHAMTVPADQLAAGIAAAAARDQCALVAMTAHAGGVARLLFGSVADELIREGVPAVLFLPSSEPLEPGSVDLATGRPEATRNR